MAGSDARARARRGPSPRAIQPGLFSADTEGPEAAPDIDALARTHDAARPTAAALPAEVRFGTSSWSFPGWQGLVYSSSRTQAALARDGLREYAAHPLLRTVGVDRSYYAPIPVDDLRRYADQLPAGFQCCFKAPATVASAVAPHARGVAPAPNPDFLSAERLSSELLEPVAAAFRDHAGPFVIECAPLPRGFSVGAREFAERLDAMLAALPGEFKYAVELRTPAWLTPEYARVLARRGAAHVYNYWSAMPMPAHQAPAVPVEAMPFVVVRLLLRPGTWYEDQRERFKPFDRIVAPDEPMRREVADLVSRAVGRAIPAFVLVNNKAEGSAPLTVAALAALVVQRLSLSHAPVADP
jgi:uncharacterized protein YecE (DUF72 family)